MVEERKYKVKDGERNRQICGCLDIQKIKELIGVTFPETAAEVYIYPGAIKHIKKRHPGIFEKYGHLIPDMIAKPDYVGKNPKEPYSIELYKRITEHLLLAIKLDPSGYLFVSSLYDLNNGEYKIKKRLASGRIVKYS